MKSKKLPFLALFLLLLFSGCKKGEDDPLISLRTRKARITGKWYMVRGSVSSYQNASSTTITYSSDEYTAISTYQSASSTLTGTANYSIEFEKDGKVILNRNLAYPDQLGITGTWNFTGNVGEAKNKEQILLHDTRTSYSRDILYNIKELRNKKMVLFRKFEFLNTRYEEEFEFKQ